MKIALFGITEIKPGRHNLKDPRFDQVDSLVAADKKTYAQVEVIDDSQLLDADVILASTDARADLVLKDLEFVETRLGRDPEPAERAALQRIQAALESEQFVAKAGLAPEDLQAVAAHSFYTNKPIAVATPADLQAPEQALLRAFSEGGLHLLPDGRGQGEPSLAHPAGNHGVGSRGEHPYGHAERLHPG